MKYWMIQIAFIVGTFFGSILESIDLTWPVFPAFVLVGYISVYLDRKKA